MTKTMTQFKPNKQGKTARFLPDACAVCILLIVLLLIPGCGAKKAGPPPRVPVTVARVVVRPEPLSLKAVGTVEPIETVAIKAQVGGVITAVGFMEGQDVQKGQLLFRIDPRPFQAALDAARAQLARDKSQAANAQIQAKRYADLVKKDYVTQEQSDTARTQAEMFKATVQADEASVEQARLNLGYTSVTSPISGRTGSLLIKRGNVVTANGTTLVVINQMDPIRVNFAIPSAQLPLVQKYAAGHKLDVRIKPARNTQEGDNNSSPLSGNGTGTNGTNDTTDNNGIATNGNNNNNGNSVVTGQLVFFDNAVDPGSGTIDLKAEFSNKGDLLWPGQFVDTELILTVEPQAITVPSAAVVTGQDGTFAFVIGPDKKAEKRSVRVNRSVEGWTVIDEGLKRGEIVVTDGQMRLVPGAEVNARFAGEQHQGRNQ
ncbi:MAG: efflux RND transporter periplasmic adaptor subunit [Candidatus Omnitrophota bacterium]